MRSTLAPDDDSSSGDMKPAASKGRGESVGCAFVALFTLCVWGGLFLAPLLTPDAITLGRRTELLPFLWGAGVGALVALALAVAALLRAKSDDLEGQREPWSTRVARRFSGTLMVVVALWGFLTVAFGFVFFGVVPFVNARGAGAGRAASCVVESCGSKRCTLSCVISSGERLDHTTWNKLPGRPPQGSAFDAVARPGRLGAWVLDASSIRIHPIPRLP